MLQQATSSLLTDHVQAFYGTLLPLTVHLLFFASGLHQGSTKVLFDAEDAMLSNKEGFKQLGPILIQLQQVTETYSSCCKMYY